ncbi:2-amino-4-oxopentanoate thiolase subunit OrtB [Oceanotoga sp. DSM 15011]|jgi:cysteine synthase|uniref:Cysteine synthase n=1 Tax=Oceanotoga teriensis TaxID=515440 RepID=A0AA45HIE2_9BACT|nr:MULTISPECIES: 2-amino-4-oxopentanoate thiolase subunit OrtB [Oceanotoga]MDN5343770.1 2-amino-4-ketopentanoate thiolase beta subunit [Oceanotoga sp.]MDO7975993.1 2-amino-4-oxopentanoate thiolase subunit OrtB [Oceanotoga teriensis]PWJ92031.1 cysteine synthase [Oceanotoga teriensis]UYO99017.1 2-amino-4-oxopentanoate thiolase subunit OrtB [Oceanotoga sp. DSM 15011]
MDKSYNSIMSRKNEIMKKSVGVDYSKYEIEGLAFDYEKMMEEAGYSIEKIIELQNETGVGNTPLVELKNINKLIKKLSPKGKGARVFVKDEATNPSLSYKDRRASVSAYRAKQMGYKGIMAATSGNYGAAVASQAVKRGLRSIIVQECHDSRGIGQPEILEKARACEGYGAEVVQISVGPELFYYFLLLLEETGYFNASLYTPFGIAGVETLGWEIAHQSKSLCGKFPDVVISTHAGGGITTGTARGLIKAGAFDTKVIGASVDLSGLHMASDNDFNKKSFTTGHTGFGIPFAVYPDRSDVPRNAARVLRYMDRYLLVTQGEVFYMTEALAVLEGMQRGPAGNTSLTAAFALAQEMNEDEIIVINETEYTGAGKLPSAQLTFAKENGIAIKRGDPIEEDIPGKNIIIPENPSQIKYIEYSMDKMKRSYVKQMMKRDGFKMFSDIEIKFMAEDTNSSVEEIKNFIKELK